ncbi:MAG: ABC transporter permease [Blastocatellia bacterium]|nr:ABC transporter permease [Blastocatellia bacterium]
MISDLLFRLRAIFRRRSVEAELDDELRFHLEHEVEKLTRSGLNREEASRRARLSLGGMDQVKEECRDARGVSVLESSMQDLRYGMRGLCRNPGLAILATLTLSLGMAASTVVFSIFEAALLRPMPFRNVDRVVDLWETRVDRGIDRMSFTEANFWDVRSQNRSFEEVAALNYYEANMTGAGPAEKVAGSVVTAGFFRVLGVSPILGRDFLYEEDRGGLDNRVVILGNRFWKERFGGDPQIIGKTLRLNDQSHTVVGVLPPGEPWINDKIYTLFGYRAGADRGSWDYAVVGRLAPGVSADAARTDLRRIAGAISQSYPNEAKGLGFRLGSSSEWGASSEIRRALWVLLGAVTFLLLIGCINVANLLLARGAARQREIAVRIALGASRARLARFVMMEALLLSGFGVALGLALAYGALRVTQALEIPGIPRLADASLNLWVLGFAIIIAALTGLLSGLAPALQGWASGVAAVLRESDRQKGSRGQGRLRAALVTCEVALSFLLLVGAGLLIRSFTQLMKVNHGFQTENRLVFSVSMPEAYGKGGVGKQFMDRFFERLSAVPGVLAVGAVGNRPVEGGNPGMAIDSSSQTSERRAPWAGWRVVTPGYFRAVGLPVLRGRAFDENDKPVWAEQGQPVPPRRVMISNRLAKMIFPNEDPVGKHAILWKGQVNWDAEVIGVVGDSRERGLTSNPSLTVYLPYGRNALATEFVAHSRGNPNDLTPVVRSIVADLDPNLPVTDIRSFQEVVSRSVAPQRFNAVLLGVFSGLALLLATTGIYGVLSYTMSRRTSEIGLRMALGASASNILRMTIRQGMRPALLGIGLGAAGAWWLSRYLTALLFEIKPFDFLTYAAVAALLLATAMAACLLPGRRAMRIDPAVALRAE